MIVGCGVDIVPIQRLASVVERWGDAFLSRVFTPQELAYAEGKALFIQHLAGRFAAKEAVLKAFGAWIHRYPCPLKAIEIERGAAGEPRVVFDEAARPLREASGVDKVMVSLAHTHEHAIATAIAIGHERDS